MIFPPQGKEKVICICVVSRELKLPPLSAFPSRCGVKKVVKARPAHPVRRVTVPEHFGGASGSGWLHFVFSLLSRCAPSNRPFM